MIPPFDRAITHKRPNMASFPATGQEGHLYLDDSTGDFYIWRGGVYSPFGGCGGSGGGSGSSSGHIIVDETGAVMPQRDRLKFVNAELTDDGASTVIDMASYDKPYKPHIVSPANGDVDIPTATRLTASTYAHPYNAPIAGSRWQIATDAGFTALVMDASQASAAAAIVVTTGGGGSPILSPGTVYHARMSYQDIKGRESNWSDPVSFVTSATASAGSILQPSVRWPVDGGWVTETRFVAQVSQPEVIGALVPDKMDLQVSMTPSFAPGDIVIDAPDLTNLELYDAAVDLRNTPAPLYLRAKHKDSGAGVESRWSAIPEIWIQRLFSDLCIGIEIQIRSVGPIAHWIDKNGDPISVQPDYFNRHPVFGGLVSTTWTDGRATPATHDMVRVPPFYAHAETIGTTPDVDLKHRMWISPVQENADFHLMPCFQPSPTGLLVSAALWNNSGVSRIGEPGSVKGTTFDSVIANYDAGSQKVKAHNFHVQTALNLLMMIEGRSFLLNGVSGGSGVTNNNTSHFYRGFYGLANLGSATAVVCYGFKVVKTGIDIQIAPANAIDSLITYRTLERPTPTNVNIWVSKIVQGYDSFLGCDAELYLIPDELTSPATPSPELLYYNGINYSYYVPDKWIFSYIYPGPRCYSESTMATFCRFIVLD